MRMLDKMTLLLRVLRLPFVKYFPAHEVISNLPDGKEESIWDTLGIYDPIARIIVIDEEKIKREAEKLGVDFYILRELVRLHEHVHAFLHLAVLEPLPEVEKGNFKEGCFPSNERYLKLPKEINESVTELIVKFIAREDPYKKIIKKVKTPYANYIAQLENTLSIIEPNCVGLPCIYPLVVFLRHKKWKNWKEFIREILNERKFLKEAIARYCHLLAFLKNL